MTADDARDRVGEIRDGLRRAMRALSGPGPDWLGAADALLEASRHANGLALACLDELAREEAAACGLIRAACGEAANGLPTRGASRTPGPGGRAQVGGSGRTAGEGARHEKN